MHSKARKFRMLAPLTCLVLAWPLPSHSQTPIPIGSVSAVDATVKGSVEVASYGTQVMSGSLISAGRNNSATLRLLRGGEVRVCPNASLSLSSSKTGRDLSFAIGTGAIEMHYKIGATADTILTPDFRILLAGPGVFHFAVAADNRGNACVRALENDTAAVIVSEQMGDGVYQVRPGEQAYFHNGSVADPGKMAPPDCGCPPPPAVRMATEPVPPTPVPDSTASLTSLLAASNPLSFPLPENKDDLILPPQSPEALIAEKGEPSGAQQGPVITSPDGEIHVQVDAPFVFRGEPPVVPPPPTLAHIGIVTMPNLLLQDVPALPPARHGKVKPAKKSSTVPVRARPKSKGFFGHIRSFFAAIFK